MTTCQICGRTIKLTRGVIADHGYQQPWLKFGSGDGSRTATCPGSRHLPYELSRDAIKPEITAQQSAKTRAEGSLEKLRTDPPTTLRYARYDAWGRPRFESRDVERPEGFDGSRSYQGGQIGSYGALWDARRSELTMAVRGHAASVEFLQGRYDAWTAPLLSDLEGVGR